MPVTPRKANNQFYRGYTLSVIGDGNLAISKGHEVLCTKPTEDAARAWIDARVREIPPSQRVSLTGDDDD